MDFGSFFATYFAAILIFNALLAFIPAYIAREKGRSFGAFWALSFFTTIFVGLIAVLALPQMEKQVRTVRTDEHGKVLAHETEMPEAIKCPFCAEFVKSEASVCRFCQKDISKHVATLKAQIAQNVEMEARETAARERENQIQFEANRLAEIERAKERSAMIKTIIRSPLTIAVGAAIAIALTWYGIASFATFNEAAQIAMEKEQKAMEKEEEQEDVARNIESKLVGCLNGSEFTVDFDGLGVPLLTKEIWKLECASTALLGSTSLPNELIKFANSTDEGMGYASEVFMVGNGKVQVTINREDVDFKIILTR